MNVLSSRHDYERLLLGDIPLLDVRAPSEFNKGAFVGAENAPILSDTERQAIGICYKEKGQEEAVKLGYELVQGEIKQQRVKAWQDFIERHPNGALYCFRGEMRSKIAQQWLYEATGIDYPRIEGGYKALRQAALDSTTRLTQSLNFLMLGGRTGVGKTLLIKQLSYHIDLEGLANHTGSAFGKTVKDQPTQINFENQLATTLLRYEQQGAKQIILEDEGRLIGSIHLPPEFYDKMQMSPIVLLEASHGDRVRTTVNGYINSRLEQFREHYDDEKGFEVFADFILEALYHIRKRLGPERYQQIHQLAKSALDFHREANIVELHIPWIRRLLVEYYDSMYDDQLKNKYHRVLFSGRSRDLQHYLKKNGISIQD